LSEDNSVKQKAKDMALLTVLSNKISSVQEKNMKMYPFIFFNEVKEARLEYDLERVKTVKDEAEKNASTVSYYLTLDEAKNGNLDFRFKALESAIRVLFWSDVTVEIYLNDRISFKSKKNGRQ
jgi:hypothetical protein